MNKIDFNWLLPALSTHTPHCVDLSAPSDHCVSACKSLSNPCAALISASALEGYSEDYSEGYSEDYSEGYTEEELKDAIKSELVWENFHIPKGMRGEEVSNPHIRVFFKYKALEECFGISFNGPAIKAFTCKRKALLTTEEVLPYSGEEISIANVLKILNGLTCAFCSNEMAGNLVYDLDHPVEHKSHPISGHKPICNNCVGGINHKRSILLIVKGISDFKNVVREPPVAKEIISMYRNKLNAVIEPLQSNEDTRLTKEDFDIVRYYNNLISSGKMSESGELLDGFLDCFND